MLDPRPAITHPPHTYVLPLSFDSTQPSRSGVPLEKSTKYTRSVPSAKVSADGTEAWTTRSAARSSANDMPSADDAVRTVWYHGPLAGGVAGVIAPGFATGNT